jgi:signal transduction histidine kinase
LVQLRTQRAALALYGVLLVLPTVVLGGLQWHQIVQDKDAELHSVPFQADDSARRLRDTLREELGRLVEVENRRPFQQYAPVYYPDPETPSQAGEAQLATHLAADSEPRLRPSPLDNQRRPVGVLAWFAYDLSEHFDARIDLFAGNPRDAPRKPPRDPSRDPSEDPAARAPAPAEAELRAACRDLMRRSVDEPEIKVAGRLVGNQEREVPLRIVVASRMNDDDPECLQAPREILDDPVDLTISPFQVRFYREADGTPRVVATRRVLMLAQAHLSGLNECLHRLSSGMYLEQGFFIDPAWLFRELPEKVASTVLGPSQRFVPPNSADCCDGRQEYHAVVRPVAALGIESPSAEDQDYGIVKVAVDTADIERRFRSRAWRFFGVAAMLALSLSTGMALLLRSVNRDLEQAKRTENFVAAVTHELRTPLSSIKLHGEMLLEGWASDPAKQREYYRRIVRETGRLSTLVERVLEKARLTSGAARPFPGDLSSAVGAMAPQVRDTAEGGEAHGEPDVVFDLAENLPPVLLSGEAIASIVVNLVENARKYAPVDRSRPDAEPIRVVTRLRGGRVVLEVLDRGPGIDPEEARRVFEAFYRVGNEATRTSRGTGLGLHLVALHAQALGGAAEVEPRAGGGSIFRVEFQSAPEGHRAPAAPAAPETTAEALTSERSRARGPKGPAGRTAPGRPLG